MATTEKKDYRIKRLEGFTKAFEFELEHKGFTTCGLSYFALPEITKNMNPEQALWYTFLNGIAMKPTTAYLIYTKFPEPKEIDIKKFSDWFHENKNRLHFNRDRRFMKLKNSTVEAVERYLKILEIKGSQGKMFETKFTSKQKNYSYIEKLIELKFKHFGRMSIFSYTECLDILGYGNMEPINTKIDLDSSHSHRKGILYLYGKENLIGTPDEKTTAVELEKQLFETLKTEIKHEKLNAWTIETSLCYYKGWWKNGKRYMGVYHDEFYEELKKFENEWGDECDISFLWKARKRLLPEKLLLENYDDPKKEREIRKKLFLEKGELPNY